MTDESRDPFPPADEGPLEPNEPVSATTVEGSGIAWGAIAFLIGIALVVILAVQNTDPVPVHFLWMDGEFSLAIVILVAVGVAVLLTELVGLSYRSRRRKRRAEKEELKRLRDLP